MSPLLITIIAVAAALVFWGGVVVICRHISRVNDTMGKMADKLASLDTDNKSGGTVLLPVTRLDPKAEVNTVLPLPMGAEICQHTMDIIINQTIKAPHEERAVVILQCTKCGAMDKTIAVTSPPPPPPPSPPLPPQPKSECRHQWIKEKTVNLDSAFEQMEAVLKQQFLGDKSTKPASNASYNYSRPNARKKVEVKDEEKKDQIFLDVSVLPAWMFQKKTCMQRICSKCGEVDRVVVSNFDIEEEDGKRMGEAEEDGMSE